MASSAVHLPQPHSSLESEQSEIPIPENPRNVQTTLTFSKHNEDGSAPPPMYIGKPESYNRPTTTLPATIYDISGHELDYTLDSHGFEFYCHESKMKEFTDHEKIRAEYYPETEKLLHDATGATRFFVFDHTVRQAAEDWTTEKDARGPVQRVHIDSSYAGAEARVRYHFPDEASELLKHRYQMISVWRPIKPILKDPLAVADAHSTPESDLFPVKIHFPDREVEGWAVKANPQLKWYYRYGQPPNLVTLIKLFDSKVDGRARRVPHTAFVNPATEHEAPRASIELRALIFHPDDPN